MLVVAATVALIQTPTAAQLPTIAGEIISGTAKTNVADFLTGNNEWLPGVTFQACIGASCTPAASSGVAAGTKITSVDMTVQTNGEVDYHGRAITGTVVRVTSWFGGAQSDLATITVQQPRTDTTDVSAARPTTTPTSSFVVDPTQRSWPLTVIEDEGPTEFWFPIGRGRYDMKDWDRPWTWKRWTPPTTDKCGWISIPDVRADLEEPVDELAFKVWTALLPSPDISGRAAFGRPSGRSIKLAVWALYPHPERDSNSVRRLKGPYEQPITVCLPGTEAQAIYGYDKQEWKWVALESVEAEHEGHICGLHEHDLGLLVVSRN